MGWGSPYQPYRTPSMVRRKVWIPGTQNSGPPWEHYVAFNGTTSVINCGSNASLDDKFGASFTVDAWIRPDSIGGAVFGTVAAKCDLNIPNGWIMSVQGGASAFLIASLVFDGTTGATVTIEGVTFGEWAHVVWTYKHAVDRKVYCAINGVWCTYGTQTATVGSLVTDAAASQLIGATNNNAVLEDFFSGDIGWVRLSSSIRYPSGVAFVPPSRYTTPASDGDTIEIWGLDEGSGPTTAASKVPLSNAGTLTACTWDG